ncbi:hypothetical protein RV12_GL000021 [Enterococcus quebecensis]|nr:hypothetical protein RV12_GL000021 [Enterococcus quebecensis]
MRTKRESVEYFLDAIKLCLVIRKKRIPLTRKEFKIIELLYENMVNIAIYREINEVIYGN